MVSYHKFDAKGNTQIYNARFEDGAWKVYQTSDWTYRWDFSGNGAIISEIHLSGVKAHPDGSLTQHFQHKLYGSGTWRLDEGAFKPLSLAMDEKAPAGRGRVENAYPGMTLQQARDLGRASDGRTYRLEWDTLEENRDRARPGDPPPPINLALDCREGVAEQPFLARKGIDEFHMTAHTGRALRFSGQLSLGWRSPR